jgi:hypothetical protein
VLSDEIDRDIRCLPRGYIYIDLEDSRSADVH